MAGSEDKINNYTLGRGELHFGQYKPGTTVPRGERYFGNSPELAFNATQETLDHYNSDRGIRVKDASVTLQQDYAGSFSLDSIDMDNLAMFFLGDKNTITTASRTVTAEPITDVEIGLSYQLGTSATDPAGVRQISAATVTNTTTPANVPVAGADFVIDLVRGRITILEGSTKIAAGDDLALAYTVDASTREQVISKGKTVEGSLRFLANNPAGKNIDYFMPWVKITPNGDFNLKGDDWQVTPYTLEILKKGSLEAIYADGQPFIVTP
ncbi:hypothetical protein GOD54_23685 [Sinorhizobium medicae]|nr:hypothetical protein [Sinorhizobium medicae]